MNTMQGVAMTEILLFFLMALLLARLIRLSVSEYRDVTRLELYS